MKICTLFAVVVRGVYCGRSCVNCVFNGINHSEVFKSRGPDKLVFRCEKYDSYNY